MPVSVSMGREYSCSAAPAGCSQNASHALVAALVVPYAYSVGKLPPAAAVAAYAARA